MKKEVRSQKAKVVKEAGKAKHAVGVSITMPCEVNGIMTAFIDVVVPRIVLAVADTVSEAFRLGTKAKCKCRQKKAGK